MTEAQPPLGKLGGLIRALKAKHKIGLGELTVLSAQNDPYRLATQAGHRDAQWFVEEFERALGRRDSLHLRGLHYAIVARGDVLKPNGEPYINDDANWQWLQMFPAKAARWLGYVRFDKIRDNRNDPPAIHRRDPREPRVDIFPGGLTINLPDAADLNPEIYLSDFKGRQPYHL